MVILLDMDGVLADTDTGFIDTWKRLYSSEVPFDVRNRTQFAMSHLSDADKNSPEANAVFKQAGFFMHLKPKPGALEAVRVMVNKGHEIFILTSAGINYPLAATEKYTWVAKHFGPEMVSRLIITPAKHMVKGDILIDDRPHLPYSEEAEWEHVLFDTPYNRSNKTSRRLNWQNWQEVLDI